MMITSIPDSSLNDFINCFWTVPSSISKVLERQEIMTPGTTIELIFNPVTPEKIFLIRGSTLIGKKNSFSFPDDNSTSIFGITFKINGLYPFSRFSLKDFIIHQLQLPNSKQAVVSPADILGESILALADQLFEAKSFFERTIITNKYFTDQLPKTRTTDYFTNYLISELFNNKGRLNIDQLSQRYNVNKKTIERRFMNVTGFNPKMVNRIIRFNHILKFCTGSDRTVLAAMIFELGYYDNAHFQKDFKSFTQLSPSKFISQDYQIFAAAPL